jgi:hypothetical protein
MESVEKMIENLEKEYVDKKKIVQKYIDNVPDASKKVLDALERTMNPIEFFLYVYKPLVMLEYYTVEQFEKHIGEYDGDR